MTKRAPAPHIVTAWAEPAAGPGWANSPVWYLVRDADGAYKVHCLQPDEQTDMIRALYRTASAAHADLVRYVREAVGQ